MTLQKDWKSENNKRKLISVPTTVSHIAFIFAHSFPVLIHWQIYFSRVVIIVYTAFCIPLGLVVLETSFCSAVSHWDLVHIYSLGSSNSWCSRVSDVPVDSLAKPAWIYPYRGRRWCKKYRNSSPGLPWIRIHLPMQGTWIQSWPRKISQASEQRSPCTRAAEACARVCAPQQEKTLQREACILQGRVAPTHRSWRKPRANK